MNYHVHVGASARKRLLALPNHLLKRVDARIHSLADEPRPRGAKKLLGHRDLYRIRVGDHRVVYQVRDREKQILVTKVAPRGDVYTEL